MASLRRLILRFMGAPLARFAPVVKGHVAPLVRHWKKLMAQGSPRAVMRGPAAGPAAWCHPRKARFVFALHRVAAGVIIFCEQILQRGIVEHGVRPQPLQPGVLTVHPLQALSVEDFETTILGLPVLKARLADPVPDRIWCNIARQARGGGTPEWTAQSLVEDGRWFARTLVTTSQ
jgi:hypothetical protein